MRADVHTPRYAEPVIDMIGDGWGKACMNGKPDVRKVVESRSSHALSPSMMSSPQSPLSRPMMSREIADTESRSACVSGLSAASKRMDGMGMDTA